MQRPNLSVMGLNRNTWTYILRMKEAWWSVDQGRYPLPMLFSLPSFPPFLNCWREAQYQKGFMNDSKELTSRTENSSPKLQNNTKVNLLCSSFTFLSFIILLSFNSIFICLAFNHHYKASYIYISSANILAFSIAS